MNHINRIKNARTSTHAHMQAVMAHPAHSMRKINIGLMIVAVAFLLYYVVQVNMMAAQGWSMRDANTRLASLQEAHNNLVADQATLEDRQSLADLAQQQGLVPAGSVVYLVQDHTVAAAR